MDNLKLIKNDENIERSFYFKALEDIDVYDYLEISLTSDPDEEVMNISIKKLEHCPLHHFTIAICFNYGEYENLQDICDDENTFSVINALGKCFS